MTPIRIGTRGSRLAMWQANEVSARLEANGYQTEIVAVRTTGDKRQDVSLASIGGKGLFIKELEEALERREIDIAVHSLKDVPSIVPQRFTLAAFLERADPRDAFVQPDGIPIARLPHGAVIGTSAPRRRAQLMHRFPALQVELIRGNIETRIAKVQARRYSAIILAAAGLTRLGRENEITSFLSIDEMVPAAGQGVIAIETLSENGDAVRAARSANDAASELAARTERAVLQRFAEQLDCFSAVAVHAETSGEEITLRAFFSDYEATRAIRVAHTGAVAEQVITAVYDDLVARGAEELVGARR